ncbi:MAG: hypothetical protein HY243_00470 [Proteobacteria bacterium]|nr:hypothetical protein [Pseudomonadota bacterium]
MKSWKKVLIALGAAIGAAVVPLMLYPVFGWFMWIFVYQMCDSNCDAAKTNFPFWVGLASISPAYFSVGAFIVASVIGAVWVSRE